MKDLIILGTGVHGGEMAHIVDRVNRLSPTWNLLGHIAPQPGHVAEFCGRPVLGTVEKLADYPQASLVADNEFPDTKALPQERFISLIDPSVFIHPTAQIGRGCVIYPNCFVGLKATLGQRVFVLSGAVINHDDVLEDGVVVCTNVSLAGEVHVESGCYLGQACTVRQKLRIGKGSLLGMGCVVIANVPAKSVMVGNPARLLRANEPSE